MFRIRRFGIMKSATVVAVMYMLIVAIFVVPIALIALFVAPSQGLSAGAGVVGILTVGVVAILGYGLLGWVFTALALALYNVAAGWVGGIEVQVETVAPPPPMPAWGTTTTQGPPSPPPAAPPPVTPPPSAPAG